MKAIKWFPIETAPKDGTDVMLLIRHKNYELHPSPKWEEAVIGYWTDHNGGGWVWHGLYGTPVLWRPASLIVDAREPVRAPKK